MRFITMQMTWTGDQKLEWSDFQINALFVTEKIGRSVSYSYNDTASHLPQWIQLILY